MRIALFTETFLPRVDGIVTTLCYLLEHLKNRRHEAILFSPTTDQIAYAGTPVFDYNGFPFPLYPEFRVTPPTKAVRAHLLRFRPDVIHVLSPVSLGLAGIWYGHRLNVPVVASYHTDVVGYAGYYGLGFLRSPLWAALRLIHNQADVNLCPSLPTRMELEAQGFHRVRIWTRGVDTARFSPTKFSPEWRRRLSGGEPEKPLLLYVGRVSVEKRLAWLHSVLSTIPGLRLAIVGDGPDRARLENLFAGLPVVFTGYLRGEELAHAYASADIFVFPAANETLGNVVLEAMSSGLVVVAANSGGPRDLINHRANGLLFTPESRGDLVRVIRDLLAIPGWMNQLRTAARAEALTRSWEVVFDALLEEYAMLADFATQHPWREIGFYRREGWKARYKGAGLKDHSALY